MHVCIDCTDVRMFVHANAHNPHACMHAWPVEMCLHVELHVGVSACNVRSIA